MAKREDEDLQMALRMSLQSSPPSPPEPKRSRPGENVDSNSATEESSEVRRRLQRELMAAAAEKRISMAKTLAKAETKVVAPTLNKSQSSCNVQEDLHREEVLSIDVANHLFLMMFGEGVSRDILSQWSNQGIRFSSDLETSMGLVQHEGGPCGVLATIQAFVLKYVLFHPEELGSQSPKMPSQCSMGKASCSVHPPSTIFSSLSDEAKSRALVLSMVEILFSCGNNRRAVIASIKLPNCYLEDGFLDSQKEEIVAKSLETLSIESSEDLLRILRVNTYYSELDAYYQITSMLSIFQSRMGAMLFLISSLLSRGLESVQEDRDDPSLPLVTAPFGHASQEIVNLLLCGEAVPNVFDGRMDLGGGMSLKGIPTNVEVGFLTLLESLNFCKVGQHLKCPRWPIWVVGSESHYTVLFALDTSVQDENELEERESKIRRAFDNQDQSGGGGFISVEGFQQVVKETNINFPPEKVDNLCSTGFIVWSEFWQTLLQLDESKGGMKDSAGLMGKKQFDLYHFNGIAKSVPHLGQMIDGENPTQRPRLSKLRVVVPPKWTPEEFLADVGASNLPTGLDGGGTEVNQPEPSQHAPLVDCIRTRWPRAICSWAGDAPSIV